MRLQGCVDGRLYGTVGRTLFVEREADGGSFQRRGTIPGLTSGRSQFKEFLLDSDYTRGLLERIVGDFSVATVQGVSRKSYVATAGRQLSISHDGGKRWQPKRALPESSPPFGALPSAIEATDERIYVGEYPLTSDQSPGVLVSDNDGETWQRIPISDVRHIHSVQKDPYSDEIWITTGDTDDECWIGRLRDGRFEPIGGGSQQWRAVELAFTPDAILWGMDCSYADQNRVFRLERETLPSEAISKRPRTVHTVDGSVFYSASVERGGDRWIAFSTAAEPSTDSTAPERSVRRSESAGVVVSSSASDFTDWQELRRYSRRQVVGDRIPGNVVPKASAYVYLAADDERGLFLNPYNTSRSSGSIERIPIDQLPK
ncbi:BNR repeat-containing protein with probable glycosyl-binding activity [Halalkaliarchaeum sp. AArc-CO]|uniref:WD40/YVTN/BNR-like repeat-containing protein n=1 Tax=Halalkaliarchaeum sp. AArc-CO TaxID=2866381 RepID=UPI00217D2559|nr:glycosyl hydrolase [Halalkaliarchaeum sp. AArc-CO]UWG50174.1 BNR repeat-containing protein with probable glycosyl-binding activity [Halalkaliarchaeum sp. AArc-CO]